MPAAVSLLLVVFFLLMNAFFVVAEFALVRVRKSQIDLAVEDKRPGAANAKLITENVNAYLSACQLGITLASLALGWLGEPAVSHLLHPLLDVFGLPATAISAIAVALGFIIITALHIVVGELIPKSLAIFSTEPYARFTATPLVWFYRITYPIMWLFNSITTGVMRLLGHGSAKEHEAYTDDELRILIEESVESGLVAPAQSEYVSNIFDLGDKDAEAIMTPRIELACLDLEDPLEDSLKKIRQYKYTRYPVMRGNKDNIVGFVHIKDLYGLSETATVHDLPVRDIKAVPSSISVAKLLGALQENHTKIAVVVDEHGGTAGIVTMSDIMDEIVGRCDDEYVHEDEEIKKLEAGHYQVAGSLPVDELYELLGFVPEQEGFETAGGLLFDLFGQIPEEGDAITLPAPGQGGTQAAFTVLKMDGHRVDQIDLRIEGIHTDEAGMSSPEKGQKG
ncbi:MAG: hemolysin family protein [Coriobacteriaceae bacterium]|jgi:CBS domain containing-hemolysin-like protein|nr:hemolysin family protein [Coriobacteriaceae bacterium]